MKCLLMTFITVYLAHISFIQADIINYLSKNDKPDLALLVIGMNGEEASTPGTELEQQKISEAALKTQSLGIYVVCAMTGDENEKYKDCPDSIIPKSVKESEKYISYSNFEAPPSENPPDVNLSSEKMHGVTLPALSGEASF